jgi:hypothetical protein
MAEEVTGYLSLTANVYHCDKGMVSVMAFHLDPFATISPLALC